jgi:anti-anti-sigma factor
MPTPFAVEQESARPGTLVLRIVGELDLAVADRLQEALQRAEPADRVVVDLIACEFIDSTGLAVVLRGQQRQASGGGRLVLCNPNHQVRRVLEVSGLTRDDLLVADRDEALGS